MKITAITFSADHMVIAGRPIKHLRLGRHPWADWSATLEGDAVLLAAADGSRAYRIGSNACIIELEPDDDASPRAVAGPGRGHKGPRG